MTNDAALSYADATHDLDAAAEKIGRKRLYHDVPLTRYRSAQTGNAPIEVPRSVFFRIVNDSRQGDQAPLRMFWKLAEREKTNVSKLVLEEEELAVLLTKHELHANPHRYARQILICLGRVLKTYPGLLTNRYEPVLDLQIRLIPEQDRPEAFRRDIEAWLRMTPVMVQGTRTESNALVPETIDTYVRSANTVLVAFRLSGPRLDPTVGVGFLIQPRAIARWLRVITEREKPSTVQGHLAALLRIARDLPGMDLIGINFLEARLQDVMKGKLVIDADKLAALAAWTEPHRFACLVSAPDALMTLSENPASRYLTRLMEGGSGFALQLMWEHPGLSERAIAEFDLARHIAGNPGARSVLRAASTGRRGPGSPTVIRELMSAQTERLCERLLEVRRNLMVETTLLLPGRDGRPREVRAAMEVVYNRIQGVLGERLTSSRLRDINTYIALDNGSDVSEVAAGAGYRHARSLERRLGPIDQKPRREGGGLEAR